jgi:hypothetical protein
MTEKYTPRPWTNDDGLVNGIESRKRGAGSPSLDIFDAADWPHELQDEAQANARLIAAAPDMLAVLQKLKWISIEKDNMKFKCETTCFVIDELNAAIAKATGA